MKDSSPTTSSSAPPTTTHCSSLALFRSSKTSNADSPSEFPRKDMWTGLGLSFFLTLPTRRNSWPLASSQKSLPGKGILAGVLRLYLFKSEKRGWTSWGELVYWFKSDQWACKRKMTVLVWVWRGKMERGRITENIVGFLNPQIYVSWGTRLGG